MQLTSTGKTQKLFESQQKKQTIDLPVLDKEDKAELRETVTAGNANISLRSVSLAASMKKNSTLPLSF